MLGTMLGGYNVKVLIDALKDENIAKDAAEVLKNIIFVHDNFHTIAELSKNNPHAKEVLQSWANADWFNKKEKLPQVIKCIVFKVTGETNTDDLSPAGDAFTRSDIPLHANAMLKVRQTGSLEKIKELKKKWSRSSLCRRCCRNRFEQKISNKFYTMALRKRNRRCTKQA